MTATQVDIDLAGKSSACVILDRIREESRDRAALGATQMDRSESAPRPDWLSDEMYPFENRFFTTACGHRMHFVDEGEPVVFVHGNSAWSFGFRHLIEGLRSGLRCVAAGHERSRVRGSKWG